MASNRKFLLLCAFVASTVAVPVTQREQCARYCTEEGDFKLRPGSMYTYDYETTTTTTVQGSSQDKTQLQLTAQVDIEVISKCDLSLRLRGVTLKHSDPESPEYLNSVRGSRDFSRSVESHILRFSFQNGKVEHVCPSSNAPVWVTNLQKGVLSAFQTYILQPDWSTTADETDVLGKCKAEYQSLGTSWQGTHTIRKLKDLSTCTDRENVDTYLQGTPYGSEFKKKSLPLIKGSQECEQVIGQGFLQSSTCKEKLIFRPFSNGGSSVITSVTQKLSYSKTSQRTFTGNDYRPTAEPLLFRHADMEEVPSKRLEDAEAALRELCDESEQDISMTVPRKFSTFVYKLKKLQLGNLRNFYQKIEKICPTNTKARKFFMDAIPLVATTDSAKFMYDLISRNEISSSESGIWLTSLSFVNEPTAETISVFIPLLDGRHDQAILGVSAMIHTFCKSNDCSNTPEIQNAVHKLFRNLGESCFGADDKKVILTLKALSNIGIMFGKENVLENCYKNPQIRLETRIAAIQAYRRVSCDTSRENLMRLFSNYNEDPEIRIASYLAVMACPNSAVIDAVKEVLKGERINHVGSFVWTHLLALAKTKHPQRQAIRDIFSNLYLLNKYNSDARKFSTAREATFFLESIDSGFHVDTHLIFSTDSYLPRSAMFNLTVDVFGKTCNLFQIDGRMEGLEHLAESFFGPGGYFPQKNIAKLLREKRSLSYNKVEDMDNKFAAKSRFQQSPYGSLDVKIFGTTLWYNQFKDNGDGAPDINLLEVVTKLAEDHEAEYSRSFQFLDTTFTVPMTSGLPLRIAVNGTASVALKYGGRFDVKSFEHVDVHGHIEPSGAVEIASLLTVEAGSAARSGLRVVGTMHSSTVLDGRLEIKNGEVVKAQLNMPRNRIDVFNLQSKVYLVHGNEEREPKVDRKGETNLKTCTGPTIGKLFGIELCSELRLPPYKPNSAIHPVNGPANFNIYIKKTDPSLKSYNFDAEWKLDVKNGEFIRHGVIAFNTPDSQTDRDVKAELYINHAERTASLKIKTPMKRMGANAKLISEKGLEKLALGLTVDDKDYFSLQTELRTTTDKSSITYMPSLEIRIPSRRLASVTGSLYLKHGQKYTGQLQIEDLTEKPILAKGNIEIGKRDRYDGEISINSYVLDGTVKGYAQLGDSMASRIQAEYKFLEGKTNKINIMGKMRDLSANALTKFNGLLNFQASLLPEWNTEIAFETMRTTGHIEDTLSISLGDGARSRVHSIRLQEILRYEGDLKNNKIDGSLSIVYPEKNIDYALKVNHENTEKSLKNVLDIQYGSRKHIMSEVVFNMNKDTPFSVAGDIKLKYPGRETALSASLSETSPKEYTATVLCKWQEGRQSSILINYKDKTDSSRLKYEVEGELNIPLRSPITFSSVIGTQSGQFAGFAEVNVGVDKYRAKVDYAKGKGNLNHRAKGELILNNKIYGIEAALQNAANKLSCNAEVKMPNRHRVIVKFEGRTGDFLQTGSFETLWDADRDTSKRFGINGELRRHADGYESKIVMQIRRRTITGILSTSMKGRFLGPQWNTNNKIEVEWSPSEKATAAFSSNMLFDRSRQELNGVLEVTTPYADYENLTLSLTHFYANQQWESELSTLLPKNNQIQFLTSGKYSFSRGGATFETKTQLQTSFSQLRDTYLELSHDHSPRELTSKMLLKWSPSKRITFDISAVAQPSVYKGALKLNSPFKNFEDISSEIVHNHSPDNFRTRLEFQWATRRKMSVNVEGRHVLNGRRRICTVSATGSFPHKDFENTQAKITYSNDGITLNTDMELHWSDRKKIVTSFTGSSRNSPYSRNIESKILVTTPFRNYESYQVSSSLETNRNSYKVNVDAQLPYRSSASFNSQAKVLSLKDIELNAVFVGQFPRYMQPQRASIDFVHKYENSKLRSTLDTSYNKYRLTVLLNGLAQIGYDNRNIEFSASINSPFSGFEEVKCNFIHNKRGFEYNTRLEASKNAVTGSLIHKLNIRDALNFETTFDASSSEFLDAKLSMIQVYREGQLEHNSYATWDRNKRINLNTQATLERHRSEITIDFTSPFEAIRSMKSSARYQTSVEGLSVMVATEWNRANRYLFEGEYKIGNRIAEGKLSLLTPFRGYRTVDIQSKLNYGGSRKSGDISLKWENGNKILFNSEYFVRRDGRALRINIQTSFDGYERISFDSAYKLVSGLYEGEVNAQINRNVPYKATAFVKYGGEHILDFKINLESPDYRMRNLRMMVTVDSEENSYKELTLKQINSSFVLNDKESTFSAIYHRKANEFIEGKINVATPYYQLRNLRIAAKVNTERNPSSSVNKITSSFVLNDQESTLSAEYRRENDQSSEVKINIASPDERLRNLRIRATVNTEKKASRRLTIHRIDSSAILNDKESTFTAEYHNEGNKFVQVNMRLDSPYRDYRTFSLQSSLRRESFESVDASLKLETPFSTLPKLDTQLQWNVDDSGCTFSFNCNTAEKRLNLQGKVSNRQFRPFTAVIEIDAPFLSFRKLSANADINIVRWDNSKIILSVSTPRSSHTLNLSLLREDRNLNFQIKVESPSLSSNAAILTVKANYENENNIQTESSLQLMGKVHYLNGQLGRSDRSTEVQIRMESPLLPEKKAEITASLSRRRGNKILEGKANFISPSSNHEINMKYENKNSQITANLKIDSSLLEFSHFESEAKYTNSNGKDIEATFSASTPQKSFSFIGSLKNYDGEKYGQLKIECPCIDVLESFSITGTAKYDSFKSMEGSLSIGTNRKELRIAGNMKNDEWKDIEGFVTVNTPFEILRMLRVDGRFRNDRFQNIDWSLNVETSNKNVPNLGVTSKISRTKGSEEISLMFHLPLRNYRTVQLLANAHYKPDFSSADSRITLTIPPNSKYSISGQYEVENPKLSGTAELEYNGQKWVASGRLERAPENNDVSISFMTPNSDRYKFGGAYGVSGNKRFVAGSYISPSNAKYDVNTSLSFIDLMNFEATIQAETPFYEYRNIEASIHQQYNSNFLSTNVDYLKNSRRGSLRIIHRNMRNSVTGSIHLNCPFQRLRDLKISYNHSKKSRDQECSLELDLNKVKQFKAELIQFGERSSHVIIDVPVLPLTMTADSKKLQYGRELNFKNTYMSRIVGFRTSYQREPSQILHDASFTWDERAEKRISYDFKLGETATGRELWSRLDTPLRSFMLKGNFTKANRASSGGIDFYWDASRTLEKHAAVGVEHTDMSSGRETSHRLKITVEHPKLSREIVQMNTISFSQNEFNARSELIYSRQRHHNLLLEVKTADLSRSRDSHYKGEFILRHPVTRLDIRALCEIIHNKLESFINAKVNSVDMRQVQHVHELKGTLSKIKQQIDIAVRSDNDVKSILVSAANRNGRLEVSAGIVKNDEKLLESSLRLNSRNNSVEFSITGAGQRGLHSSASYSKDFASARLWHDVSGNVITDVNVFLSLEQSRILKTQLNWRPKMWEELRITTGENLRAFISHVKERYQTIADDVSENVNDRLSLISRSLQEQLAPFSNEISNDVSDIVRDVKYARAVFERMYQNNEFFMKDISKAIEKAKVNLREIISGLSLAYEVLGNIIDEMIDEVYYTIYYAMDDFANFMKMHYANTVKKMILHINEVKIKMTKLAHMYVEVAEKYASYIQEKISALTEKAIEKVDKLVRAYAPFIIDSYYYIKNAADCIRNCFSRMYDRITSAIESNQYIVALKKYTASVLQTIQAFIDYDYAERAQEFFNQIYYNELLDSIINHPNVVAASELTNTALRKSVQIYHNLGLDVAVDAAVESVTNYGKEVFFNAVEELLSDIYEMKGGAKYEFAPHRGYVAVEVNLPTSRNSLVEILDFETYPEYQKISSFKNTLTNEFYEDFCIWDYYYKILKYFSPSYWLPTFTGHAMIAGNQHYITFDKFSYDFAGKCSYLLARDFVDGNFTAIVNYGDDHIRKSLTVLADGKKIDIGNDYKITLDDNKVESPLKIGHTVVKREGASIRIENDKKGFFILCNFVHNYCSLSVSGFYYAKTGGLFGTFNYEPKLDMLTPTRHMASDIESFAKSWEVSQGSCRSNENLASIPGNDYRVQERCKSLFAKSSSEFRACFKQVDPEPFLKMCISDLSVVHERSFDEAICESAAAYFLQCKLEGVQLKLPNYCVRCEKQDGTMMKEGEALQFKHSDPITSADVVLLVEEKECNRERVRYLGKLAQSIEDNYKQKGIRDVRFSVVAFGGNDIHSAPHVHTLDGQISGPLRSLESAIESLQFGDGPVNILEALRYAASLNFRPGTTKSFVLLKCSTCKSEEVKAEYSEMLRTLLDGDISLHMMSDHRYEIKNPNKNTKSRKIFGVDKSVAYTLKDVKDSRSPGDVDLLQQLKIPKDVCIPLAFEVSGSSFDAQFLTETKKSTNKKFMDVFARRVVKSSRTSSEWGMCCECIATVDGIGKSTCQRCVSAEIASMLSADETTAFRDFTDLPVKEKSKTRVRKHKERKSG